MTIRGQYKQARKTNKDGSHRIFSRFCQNSTQKQRYKKMFSSSPCEKLTCLFYFQCGIDAWWYNWTVTLKKERCNYNGNNTLLLLLNFRDCLTEQHPVPKGFAKYFRFMPVWGEYIWVFLVWWIDQFKSVTSGSGRDGYHHWNTRQKNYHHRQISVWISVFISKTDWNEPKCHIGDNIHDWRVFNKALNGFQGAGLLICAAEARPGSLH